MFVQHMLASLKPDGHMATIMPHGVLSRRGKEKLIREIFVKDDVLEAIISLPPGLFYGTGIPACVLVMNKNKPDALRSKVLFINADREYAEGKNQNKLRPEYMEKIDFVFTQKRELPKYSRLVDKKEIVEKHDYNLNIRGYVDNTPDPEPEDVQAHLIGGVPEAEVQARKSDFAKFGVATKTLFQPERPGYPRQHDRFLTASSQVEQRRLFLRQRAESLAARASKCSFRYSMRAEFRGRKVFCFQRPRRVVNRRISVQANSCPYEPSTIHQRFCRVCLLDFFFFARLDLRHCFPFSFHQRVLYSFCVAVVQ